MTRCFTPWHSMMSPGRASSGKMTVSSPTAQLAVFTSVTDQTPRFSLTRSVSPAQLGQSKMSPLLIPTGSSIWCPQLWQDAFGIALSSGPSRGARYVMPKSRSILPRSKPTITSPSMTVTGVARSPSFCSSSSACGSSRMFFAVNWMPF